jgi:hypothetical protein
MDDPALLRGVSMEVLLEGAGHHLLQVSHPTSSQYERSNIVASLHTFVSHTWGTGRWRKYFALLLEFNASAALCASLAFTFLASAIVQSDSSAPPAGFSALLPPLAGVASLIGCLLWWQPVRAALIPPGVAGPIVCFFDRLCICQHDPALKAEGIARMGAFLESSERMLVLVGDDHLQRLWCVYELAAFSSLIWQGSHPLASDHSAIRVSIVGPTIRKLACAFFLSCSLAFSFATSLVISASDGGDASPAPSESSHETLDASVSALPLPMPLPAMAMIGLALVSSAALVNELRQTVRDAAKAEASLASFSVRECKCSEVEDRAAVLGLISATFGAGYGVAGDGSSSATLPDELPGLDAFDEFVRSSLGELFLPPYADASRILWLEALLVSLPMAWTSGLGLAGCASAPEWRDCAYSCGMQILADLVITPLAFVASARIAILGATKHSKDPLLTRTLSFAAAYSGAALLWTTIWLLGQGLHPFVPPLVTGTALSPATFMWATMGALVVAAASAAGLVASGSGFGNTGPNGFTATDV